MTDRPTESSTIGSGFRQVGFAVDSGTSYLRPRLVGTNVAKELVFTGDLVFVHGAAELGRVNHTYPDDAFDERAHDLTERIVSGPTVVLCASKRLLDHGPEKSLDDPVRNEAAARTTVFETRDAAKDAASGERRDPVFEGAERSRRAAQLVSQSQYESSQFARSAASNPFTCQVARPPDSRLTTIGVVVLTSESAGP